MSDFSKEYNRYKYVIENIKDVVWEMDTDFIFTFVSPTSEEMTGFKPEEIIGKCMLDFLTPESKSNVMIQWKLHEQKRLSGLLKKITLYELEFLCKDGSIIWVEVSAKPVYKGKKVVGYIGSTRDVSEKKEYENELRTYIDELKKTNIKLNELATMDTLTGTFNRRNFDYHFSEYVQKNKIYNSPFSIIIFDIDHFKQINDIYGHNKGDYILQEIAEVVRDSIRDTDLLFRWGGDEFIILLPEITLKSAYKVAEKVRNAIEEYNFGLKNSDVTVSMGVGEYKKGDNVYQFVSATDSALLRAKSNGRNKVEFS
jgi:PAS domain S-box/diguanylate cyclase (GGDEF) domain